MSIPHLKRGMWGAPLWLRRGRWSEGGPIRWPVTLWCMVSVAERLRTNSDTLLIVFDLVGTLVFALEGAMRAIRGDLDFLGLLVLAFVTAVGGGIIRDLLIGATPPAAIRDWRYLGIAILGAAAVSLFYQWVQAIPDQLIVTLDAAGRAVFCGGG